MQIGFATSITTAIIFISVLIIATSAYPILFSSYQTLQDSQDDKHDIRMDQLNTAIDITDLGNTTVNNIDITVSNNGTTVLDVESSDILVDGLYTSYSATPTGHWMPLTDVRFTVAASTSTDHQIAVITAHGNSDIDIFHS